MKRALFLILATVFFMSVPASADDQYTLTLTAVADSMVDYQHPNTAYPSDPNIGIHRIGNTIGAPCSSIKTMFARFQLPNGLTGQKIGNIISANLQITQIEDGVIAGLDYYAFGVNDGLDKASCNTYTWNNAPGYDHTNVNASLNYLDFYDQKQARWLGNIATYYPGSFQMYYVNDANTREWIMSDTDGILTFFITGYQPWNYLKHFASIEYPDQANYPGPQLTFTYTLTAPKCGDAGQIWSPGDYNHDCYVNFKDLAVFASYWLKCTDRANPACQ